MTLGVAFTSAACTARSDEDRSAGSESGAPARAASVQADADAATSGAAVATTTVVTAATATASASSATTIDVTSITDGDTLVVADGRRVRLAQVDAPETNECFGGESTDALRVLVEDQPVELRRPPTGPERDRYGRTLADVVVGGVSVNEQLVASGAAEWYESFASEDVDLARRLEAAENAARTAGAGLWSACRDDDSQASASPAPSAAPMAPAAPVVTTHTTQAVVASTNEGSCHPGYPDTCLPASPDLDCPDVGERVRVDHAHGDPHRLDADGDGWGCESYG